jgi:hypothetical protein
MSALLDFPLFMLFFARPNFVVFGKKERCFMSTLFLELEAAMQARIHELIPQLEVAVRQMMQECIAEMEASVRQGHPETHFNEWTVRDMMGELSGPPREAAFAMGAHGVWLLLRSLLWSEAGITVGRHRAGNMTVHGARRGTIGAELRRQLQSRSR